MRSVKDFCRLLRTKILSEKPFAVGVDRDFAVFLLEERDAEWQARVDAVEKERQWWEDHCKDWEKSRNESDARVEKLEAALKVCSGWVEAYGQPETRELVRAALGREA